MKEGRLILAFICMAFLLGCSLNRSVSLTSSHVTQPPYETTTDLPVATIHEPTAGFSGTDYPAPGDQQVNPLPKIATAYPAGYLTATPPSTVTPTAEYAALLPLHLYPRPGPFHDMRIVYTKPEPAGYYVSRPDGTDERLFNQPWWHNQMKNFGSLGISPSPDGQHILYFASNGMLPGDPTANSLWISNPDGSSPRMVVGTTKEMMSQQGIWSPDGKQIAYIARLRSKVSPAFDYSGGDEIWIVNADGGQPRKAWSNPEIHFQILDENLLLFRWFNNGYIYFNGWEATEHPEPMYALNPDTGETQRILEGFDPIEVRASLAPDGMHLYTSSTASENNIPRAVPVLGFIPVTLPTGAEFAGWLEGGTKVVYYNGSVVVLDLASGNTKSYPIGPGAHTDSISPDGRYLVYHLSGGLYVLDLQSGRSNLIARETDNAANVPVFRFWIPIP